MGLAYVMQPITITFLVFKLCQARIWSLADSLEIQYQTERVALYKWKLHGHTLKGKINYQGAAFTCTTCQHVSLTHLQN